MKNRNHRKPWLLQYSIVFAVVCLLTFSMQIYYGKSFVYSEQGLCGDGLVQHFNGLVYYGEYLRELLRNIFVEHTFSLPEYDLSIGMGGDILATLNYYVMGDPLNLLAVFVPAQYTEILYNFLVIARLYLAGIAFYCYCLYHGYETEQILPASMIYVFSFYSIVISVLHPFFLNPLIYFPLILLGVDKVMRERKPLLFILSCALAAVSNFYFFYMMTILMFLYGIIRYVQYHVEEIKCLALIKELAGFILYYVIAVLLAAPVFLPSVYAVLGSSRVGGRSSVPAFYEWIYYIKLPIAFMNASADHYSALGYGAVGVFAVVLLFFRTKWKEKTGFKIAFVIGTVFLLFPFFGHMFNGFGYAVNRWVWAYCFLVSLIVAEMFLDILCLPAAFKWLAAGMTVLFMAPTFVFRAGGKPELLFATATLAVAAVVLSAIILVCKRFKNSVRITYFAIITVNIFLSMFSFYSPLSGNDISKHGEAASAYADIMSGPLRVLEGVDRKKFDKVRVDTSNLGFGGVRTNSAMLYDINSVSFYYSVINENTNTALRELQLPVPYENRYVDLDSRAVLSALMGVKYNIVRVGEERYLPYGFWDKTAEKDGYALYETNYCLPMAFVYDRMMGEQEYQLLQPIRKQQALLQTAIVPEKTLADEEGRVPETASWDLLFQDECPAYETGETCGLSITREGIEVLQPGAYMTLRTVPAEYGERYLAFENLWYEGDITTYITITDGTISRNLEVKSELDGAYANIHDFLCNLGYSEAHGESYTIIFDKPGTYNWSSLKIIDQPLAGMENQINDLSEIPVEYSFGEDSIQLHVDTPKAGLLYLSVPFSKGWEARMDGKQTEVVKTNNFGMGFFITPGEHTVELVYHTPYMRLGTMFMAFGIMLCTIVLIWQRKAGRNRR